MYWKVLILFEILLFFSGYANDLEIAEGDASFIMSLIGICNTVGRIIAGWISDHPKACFQIT